MNVKATFILPFLLLIPGVALALTLGLAPLPGAQLPNKAQMQQLGDYVGQQLGEKVTVRDFADQAKLDAWMNRFGEVDLGFVDPALVKAQPWNHLVLVEAVPEGQAGSWPLVVRPGIAPGKVQRLRQLLTSLATTAPGRQVLKDIGVAAFVTHGQATPGEPRQPAAPAPVSSAKAVATPGGAAHLVPPTVSSTAPAPQRQTSPETPAGPPAPAVPATSASRSGADQVPDLIAAMIPDTKKSESAPAAAADKESARVTQAPATGPVLTLRLAEKVALEQNLNLKAQSYDLLAGVAAERKNYGIYDPSVSLNFVLGSASERINSPYYNAKYTQDYRKVDAGINQTVVTGGTLGVDFSNQRNSASPPSAINPAYDSELKLSLSQPLLKNFGRTVTEQGILFAIKDRQRSFQDLRNQAFTVLGNVRDAYYEVLRSRDELAYRKTSLELAQRVLKENQARVKVGVMAPIDILEAEVGVKQREGDLLDAQRQHQDALDNLALLLNSRKPLQTGDEPLQVVPMKTDAEAGYRTALVGRPDIQQQLRDIERLEIEQKVADNQRLPSLDLAASYSHRGLGKDFSNDWEDISSSRYPNWQIGLNLSYPLGNRAAANEVLRDRVRRKALEARLGQLQEQVRNDIQSAIRLLEVSRKKVEVSSRGRDLAEEKLRTLLKRKEVGLATTRDVLQGEDDLAQARTTEISSLADYNKAVTQYLQVTGQLLDHEGVKFAGATDPESDARLLQMQNP